ncbi:MAG: hypothetical protein JRI25_23210 [Deltaproteobacteria bacterium]|nr:hypothetical protein [Deltaproteobacteria bacterium]
MMLAIPSSYREYTPASCGAPGCIAGQLLTDSLVGLSEVGRLAVDLWVVVQDFRHVEVAGRETDLSLRGDPVNRPNM